MKRTFMKFLPLVAAVLLATSCGKDDDNSAAVDQVQNPESVVEEAVGNTVKTITITGKMGRGSLSKVTVDGSNQLKLEDGLYPDVFTFGRDGVDDFYGSIQIVDADDGSYSATLNFPSEKEEQFLDGTYVATQGEPVSELKTGEADRYADLEKAVKASYYEIPFKVSHLYGDEYALETTEDVEEGESTDIMVFIRNAFIHAVADRKITFENNLVEVKDGYYYIVPSDKALGSKTTEAGKIYTVKKGTVTSVTINNVPTSKVWGNDAFNVTVTILPDDATKKNVIWDCSNAKVSPNEDGSYSVMITGNSGGKATITAIVDGVSSDVAEIIVPTGYVDLGTGVYWKTSEETIKYMFGKKPDGTSDWFIPSKEAFDLLWTSSNVMVDGFTFTNKNGSGASIYLVGDDYWSSTAYDAYYAWKVRPSSGDRTWGSGGRYVVFRVRLVRRAL